MTDGGQLCRLEYLTRQGWVVGHAGIALIHPRRYVDRLRSNGKFGRVTILDDRLQPNGEVYVADDIPDPSELPFDIMEKLVKPTVGNPAIPQLRDKTVCPHCDARHAPPFTGGCLL